MSGFRPVILYDGQCNFCLAVVKFIFNRDKINQFDFYPLQTKHARLLLKQKGVSFVSLNTLYFIANERELLKKSSAVFAILRLLPQPWKLISYFSVLPVSLTDKLYDLVARFRYLIFGKSDQVIIPQEILNAMTPLTKKT